MMHANHQNLSDQELLDKYYSDRDLNWVGILMQRYTLLLFGVGMKYLSNEEESKDMVQQVFLKALTEIQKYKVMYFKSWLYMIAKNQCLMELRSKGIHTTELTDNVSKDFLNEFDMTEILEREQKYDELQEAILLLPDEQKQCITDFYMEKKSYQTIATETGMSLMRVKSCIQNGKRNIKNSIERKSQENPK